LHGIKHADLFFDETRTFKTILLVAVGLRIEATRNGQPTLEGLQSRRAEALRLCAVLFGKQSSRFLPILANS